MSHNRNPSTHSHHGPGSGSDGGGLFSSILQQHAAAAAAAAGDGSGREKTYFEQQREALILEIAMSFEHVLANINKLNRGLEATIAVGNDFSSVEALWSQFEAIMAQRGGNNAGEGEGEKDDRDGDGDVQGGNVEGRGT